MRPARVTVAAAGIVLALAVSGCQVSAQVTLTVHPAGDGTLSVVVVLDHSAAATLPNLASNLRVNDLANAGWTVKGPTVARDGSVSVSASHAFRDDAELSSALAQLAGQGGAFHGLHVSHHRTFSTTRTRLSGVIDLRAGADAFGDPALARQLGLSSLDTASRVLAARGAAVPSLAVQLVTRLPGHVEAASTTARLGGAPVWTVPLGSRLSVSEQASERNWLNIALGFVSVVCLLVLAALMVVRGVGLSVGPDPWRGGPRFRVRRRRRRDTWHIAERRRVLRR